MSSSSQDMKILSALICDDVRREDNGKEILIGVYSGSIAIPTIPANITLTAWINMEIHGPCEFDFEIRVLDPSDRQVVHGKLHVASSEVHDFTSTVLPPFPINADKEGWLPWIASLSGLESRPLARIKRKRPNTHSREKAHRARR